jgi:hypothetical protein
MTRLTARHYTALAAGDVRVGAPAELTVVTGQSLQPGSVSSYGGVALRPFLDLAAAGGLCGSRLDPVRDAARNRPHGPPVVAGQTITWSLSGLAVDPLAVNVLFNLCETIGEAAGLAVVRLAAAGTDVVPNVPPDEYPGPPGAIPFALDVDLGGRHVAVEIYFAADPAPAALDLLYEDLEVWGLVGSFGGFRVAGRPPLKGVVVLHELPPPAGRLLTFELLNTTADPGAFDSLVGVLARAAIVYLPIDEVRIES